MRINPHLRPSTQYASERFPSDPSAREPILRVGNDIVDLEHPQCRERPSDDPLVARVLTAPERRWFEETKAPGDRMLRLWALWAAKEAAFKVLSKLPEGPTVLRHRAFDCSLELSAAPAEDILCIDGQVTVAQWPSIVHVEGTSDRRYLHLAAWNGGPEIPAGSRLEVGLEGGSRDPEPAELGPFRRHFSKEEWGGVYSIPSARVRILARERLLSHLGVEEGVEILTSPTRRGRTPPRVRVEGVDRPELDVSLSHHGRYVAWAILFPGTRRRGDPGVSAPSP